jgi:hypothetical protein
MGSTFIVHGDRVHVVGLTKPLREAADMDNHSCDERYLAYLNEQEEARRADYHSEDPAAFRRHLARIRQGAQGAFEYRAPDGLWYPYLPGGYPYGAREVEALRARGDTITEQNVLVRYP